MSTQKKKTRNLLLEIACFLSLAISVVPVIDYYSPWMITMIPVLIVLFITLQKRDNILPMILFLIAFLILGSLHYIFLYRGITFSNYLLNFVIAFLPCLVAYQVRYAYEKPTFYKHYIQALVFFTGITSITTIIGLEKYPMAARELASGTAIFDTEHYRAENIGGYEYIYTLVILIPLLIYLIKRTNGFLRFVNIAILVINIVCIYESQYTTALLLTILVFLLMLAFKNKLIFFGVTFVLLLFGLLGGLDLLSDIFLWLSESIEHEYVSDRLLQLSQLVGGQEIQTETSTSRLDYYKNELLLFIKNPVFGHNFFGYSAENVSGHSFTLDWLAATGTIGFATVAAMIRAFYRHTVRFSGAKVCKSIQLTWLMVILLSFLNPVVFPLITTVVFAACAFLQGYEESLQEPEITEPSSTKEESVP